MKQLNGKKRFIYFYFRKNKPEHYIMANKILINMTSFSEDINLFLI